MEQLRQVLPSEIYESLITAGIKSPRSVIEFSKTHLAQITKLDLNCIERVVKESAAVILKDKCCQGSLLEPWGHLSTGCAALDAITRGGIPINGITELVGCSGVGKTQICLQLAVMAQLPSLEKSVVYICTEDVFPAKRLRELSQQLAKKHGILSSFEDNIFIQHAADIEQLKRCLFRNLPKLLTVKTVGLVVIDSIAGAFRSENLNVHYYNRSQDFVSLAVKLRELSERHGFAVVCTNQVTHNVTNDVTEPCLGVAWSNLVTCRLTLTRYFPSQVREIEVTFAPDLPNKSCRFVVAKNGIVGVD